MKGKLVTWKGVVESKALRINVNKTKIVIINLNLERSSGIKGTENKCQQDKNCYY